MTKRLLFALVALTLLATACGDDGDPADSSGQADDGSATGAADDDMADEAASSIGADDQTGDGTTVIIASVTLAADGFIAIHADNDGAPGPVIGVSDLLDAGDSTDVVVTLDTPLDADAMLFPMAHIDVNENGEYDFAPPDVTTDSPATTAEGSVAVTAIGYTIG